jgi:hypothetical protein
MPKTSIAYRRLHEIRGCLRGCVERIAGIGRGNRPRLNAAHYRRLFWETGVIGQVLYLEAEAFGVRATGIGCFFDDPVHQVLGFSDATYQLLYHFTTGGPVEDPRLTTLPPYGLDH